MIRPLLTEKLRAELIANGQRRAAGEAFDPRPVVKFFTCDANAVWLVSEADPEDPDLLHALCDFGFGCPELGSVRLSEIAAVRGKLGLPVERDLYFHPKKTMSQYAAEARIAGRIQA